MMALCAGSVAGVVMILVVFGMSAIVKNRFLGLLNSTREVPLVDKTFRRCSEDPFFPPSLVSSSSGYIIITPI